MTVLMTWPWPRDVRSAVADTGDPYITAWTLWWDVHQTFRDPAHLFDANVFYPLKDTLAFTEHLYGVALPLAPLFALGIRPLTVNALATLLGFALAGYGAFRLVRTLTGSTPAAFLAGFAYAFVPYRFHQLDHLHYLFSGFIPLLFEALVLYLRERRPARAVWLGAAFLLNGLICVHWLVLTSVPFALLAIALSVRSRASLRSLLPGAAALCAAGLLLLPFLLPYQRVARRHGFVRTAEETARHSARPIHWVTADGHSRTWSGLGETPVRKELALFPGALLLVLPLPGLLWSLLRRRDREGASIAAVLIVCGVLGSFGMNAPFHRLLFEWIPIFQSIRVPARWAMVADLGLAIGLALFAVRAAEIVSRRLVFGVLGLALLVDLRSFPLRFALGEPDPDALALKLRETPMKGGLLELPAGDDFQYRYTLRAADHGRPLVNAMSGFTPPHVAELMSLSRERPIRDVVLDRLESIPVSYVAVHEALLGPDDRDALHALLHRGVSAGRLRYVGRFGTRDDLYAVVSTEGTAASPPLPFAPPSLNAAETVEEDPSLQGALDVPAEGATVTGELRLAGWARGPGDDLSIEILIDGEKRTPGSFSRTNRADVGFVIPALGDTSGAGFQASYPFRRGDEGPHTVLLVLTSAKGTRRQLAVSRFVWRGL